MSPLAVVRRTARCLTEVLPADALGLVLYQLPLAHDIAAVAPTCHALCDAAKLALKLRPFSGEVVTLAGHTSVVQRVAAAPDGRIITSSRDGMKSTVKVWLRDPWPEPERTIETDHGGVVVVLVGAMIVAGIATVWGGRELPGAGVIRESVWSAEEAPSFEKAVFNDVIPSSCAILLK